MKVDLLPKRVEAFLASPEPIVLADIAEIIVGSLHSGVITHDEAFGLQERLENVAGSPEVIANSLRIIHKLWDVIEWTSDLTTDGYPIQELQNDLTEMYSLSYSLRKSGWEPTYPYVRAYYQQTNDQGIVASAAFTAYERQRKLEYFDGVSSLHNILKGLAKESSSIALLKKAFPKKNDAWKLREIVEGYSLVSDFELE